MHKTSQLWVRFSGITIVAHLVAVLLLFFVYKDGVEHLAFIISPQQIKQPFEVAIVFEQPKPKEAPVKKQAPSSSKKSSVPTPVQAHKTAPKQSTPKAAPTAVKKEEEKKMPDHLDLALSKNKTVQPFEQEFTLLYQEVAAHWAPPSGVPAESKCMVSVIVDRSGEIDDMDIVESSGMFIFDLAARRALSEIEFPKFVWGKSITITFTL